MARYLITGGAGFIGSHLCEHFLNQGHEVLCMDNYSTGAKANIGQFLRNPRFRFIDHNVSRYIEVPEPLDYVLHFASPASPVQARAPVRVPEHRSAAILRVHASA